MERCVCCSYNVHEYLINQNQYGDIFCSTCWRLKQLFPTKTNQEIRESKMNHMSFAERVENGLKLISRFILALLVIMVIIALL
jgi:hypothetical protein